jgi:hypothetical protein
VADATDDPGDAFEDPAEGSTELIRACMEISRLVTQAVIEEAQAAGKKGDRLYVAMMTTVSMARMIEAMSRLCVLRRKQLLVALGSQNPDPDLKGGLAVAHADVQSFFTRFNLPYTDL